MHAHSYHNSNYLSREVSENYNAKGADAAIELNLPIEMRFQPERGKNLVFYMECELESLFR